LNIKQKRDFLKDKEFEYKTETERIIKKIKDISKEEEYYSYLEVDLQNLSDKFMLEKKDDLQKSKSDIKEILSGEISSRYFYQKGRIKSSINYDKEIHKALKVLENPSLYDSILQGLN